MQLILTDFKLSSRIWWIILLILSCKETSSTEKKLEGLALGTTYSIKYTSDIPERQVQKGIDSLLYLLNKSLSTYLPNSDISKINRGDTNLIVDNHFRKVFKKATALWKATSGYFDPTVGAALCCASLATGCARCHCVQIVAIVSSSALASPPKISMRMDSPDATGESVGPFVQCSGCVSPRTSSRIFFLPSFLGSGFMRSLVTLPAFSILALSSPCISCSACLGPASVHPFSSSS